jgi:HEAT repeat protein
MFVRQDGSHGKPYHIWALGKIGHRQAVPHLIQTLGVRNADVRRVACWALREIGDPQAMPYILNALQDPNANVRQAACRAIGVMASSVPISEEAIARLISCLDDQNSHVRRSAFTALSRIGDAAKAALIRALSESPSVQVRKSSYKLLRNTVTPQDIPFLTEVLEYGDALTRHAICNLLGEIRDPMAVHALLVRLGDASPKVRCAACTALGAIGDLRALPALSIWAHLRDEAARQAIEQLQQVPLPFDKAVQEVMVQGYWQIVIQALAKPLMRTMLISLGEQAIPLFVLALGEKDKFIHSAASTALVRIGAAAIPALVLASRDQNPYMRWMVCRTLKAIGDAQAVPALIRALRDENAHVRWEACRALQEIGDNTGVEALIHRVSDANSYVRQAACKALGTIGNPRAIPALIQALADPVAQVRWAACWALGMMSDPRVVPHLCEVAQSDPNHIVRAAAQHAIEVIQHGEADAR